VRVLAHHVRRAGRPQALLLRHIGWLRACILGLALCLAAPVQLASAQSRPGSQSSKRAKKASSGSRARAARNRRKARKAEASGKPAAASPKDATRKERATDAAASRAAETASGDVDSEVVKEGDTSVKVMRFSGLDVEGRLKSPQLLYFVNRVRAEFDRPRLPHRSFMPELERSTHRDPL